MPVTPILIAGGIDTLNLQTEGNVAYVMGAKRVGGGLVPERGPEWQAFQTVRGGGSFLTMIENHPEVSKGLRHGVRHTHGAMTILGFSELGAFPFMRAGKLETRIGLPRPSSPPILSVSRPICPQELQCSVSSPGKFMKGQIRSIRLAYRVGAGILPAGGAIQQAITKDESSVSWTWRNIGADQVINAIVVFVGTGGSNERRAFELPPGATSWIDDGSTVPMGEGAEVYDQVENRAYIHTFVKRIGNYEFESGPSHPSASTDGQSSARLYFPKKDPVLSAWGGEGDKRVTGVSFEIKSGYAESDIAEIRKTATGGWVIETKEDHAFGKELLILSDNLAPYFASLAVVVTPVGERGLGIKVAPTKEIPADVIGSARIRRSLQWQAQGIVPDSSGGVLFTGESPHGFDAGQMVKVIGLDPSKIQNKPWLDAVFRVYPSQDPNRLVIMGPTRPIVEPYTITNDLGEPVREADGKPRFLRHVFTLLTDQKWLTGQDISIEYQARAWKCAVVCAIKGGYLMEVDEGEIPPFGISDTSDFFGVSTSTHRVTGRRIYRLSQGGEWRLLAEIPLWQEDFVDSIPSTLLGDTPSSFYDNRAGTVVYEPPPENLRCLTAHGGRYYGFSGSRIWWTEDGTLEGWSDVYSFALPSRPLAMAPYDGRLVVLCEGSSFFVTGATSDTQIVSLSDAIDGCVAPNTLCTVDGRVAYVGTNGVVVLSGGRSETISSQTISKDFWTRPGVIDGPGGALARPMLSPWISSGYANANPDDQDRFGLKDARWAGGVIYSMFAVPYEGKMLIFWSTGDPIHAGRESLLVDLRTGDVVAMPMKPLHAAVDRRGQTWLLMGGLPGTGAGAYYPTFARSY